MANQLRIVDYPCVIQLLASQLRTPAVEIMRPLFDCLYSLSHEYPKNEATAPYIFLDLLEEILHSDYEGWMVDIEKETEWFTIMEVLEIESQIEVLFRWFFSMELNAQCLPFPFKLRHYNDTSFIISL